MKIPLDKRSILLCLCKKKPGFITSTKSGRGTTGTAVQKYKIMEYDRLFFENLETEYIITNPSVGICQKLRRFMMNY